MHFHEQKAEIPCYAWVLKHSKRRKKYTFREKLTFLYQIFHTNKIEKQKKIIIICNMKELLSKIFNFNRCTHPNVEVSNTLSYCPDCGKLIRTNWYIVKCACCGKKRMGIIKGNKILPINKYCSNCGTKEYYIEKIKNFNFFELYLAIAKKEEEKRNLPRELTQTWSEAEEEIILNNLRLLPNHLN